MQDKSNGINEDQKIMRDGLRILAKIIAEKIFDDLLKERKKKPSNTSEKPVNIICNVTN